MQQIECGNVSDTNSESKSTATSPRRKKRRICYYTDIGHRTGDRRLTHSLSGATTGRRPSSPMSSLLLSLTGVPSRFLTSQSSMIVLASVSEQFLNISTIRLYSAIQVGCCEKDIIVRLYAIAYRRW